MMRPSVGKGIHKAAAAATSWIKEYTCCLTHNLAGVASISWPRVAVPPQGNSTRHPAPPPIGTVMWPKVQNWKHKVAESAHWATISRAGLS
jgi:hypothetical protein